jgi:Fic family protein
MDISRFSVAKTGRLVPIKTPTGPDQAFVPDPLPPKWKFPESLWPKLAEAKEALGRLDGVGQTLPHPELLLTPLQRQEAITSSRIEGTYATAQELMLFEMAPHNPKSANDEANAWREVSNYSRALSHGTRSLKTLPFCGRLIRDLHKVLMQGVRSQRSTAGEWRDHQVAIGSDRRYVPPPVPEMVDCIHALEKYINETDEAFDPLVRAFLVHYQIEAIHPFSDGNGRIGRVLLSLMIGHWCNHQFPWLYLSAFFEKYKDEYVDNLFRISTDGAWEKWIEFCLNATIQQAKDAISRCVKLRLLKDNMHQKIRASGSARTGTIIEGLFSTPVVRVSRLRKTLNVSYPTAQSDIDRLVTAGILQPLGEIRPKSYYSPEIFTIAYSDLQTI